jgi:FkbH-like protein
LEDFSAVEIGWGSKAEAIARACQALKIDPSAVLFVDDNPGELIEVAERLTGVSLLQASPDVARTVNELDFFPGLWAWNISSTDALRIADFKAESARNSIQLASADKATYLRELAAQVDVWVNSPRLQLRLHELSQKTNQFNMALARLDELRVNTYSGAPGLFAVAVGLRDRLSDSGVVAAMFGRIHDGEVIVEEWVISCRALGRELESLMAEVALTAAAPGAKSASFIYRQGQRNMPALEWLTKVSGATLGPEGKAIVDIATLSTVAESPVRITIHADERPQLS